MELQIAEQQDNFLKKCNENYLNQYVRQNFLYEEDTNDYINTINVFIKKYPIFNNSKIIQLHPSAENNYPHTRPNNIICIPSNHRFPSLEKTLFHEVVHIHQRNNKEVWRHFLERKGWKQYSEEKIPKRWRDMCRINPDTILEPYWIWKNQYVPLPIFTNPRSPNFANIKVMWYDINSGILEHSEPASFIETYGSNLSQPEHPYEICAVEFTNNPLQDINMFLQK